ncbi:MAG: dihydroorotate dehydrogenase electron transfer subunit [Bacteroidales bacterium]|jgi:dihydroorotate dehydrogenase electron transfer subunit|nr:dihydroorotate dehydrogenase electron transfer subunit [Bacteroidales bacterium]
MKQIHDFTVTGIEPLLFNDFELYVSLDKDLEPIYPGQFVNVLVPDTQKTFLRRPISICDVDYRARKLRFYIRIVGNGTQRLSKLQKGDKLNILYPLGNSFTVEQVERPLLIGGGCGIAPLFYLAKNFARNNIRPTVLTGGQTAEALSWINDFETFADLHRITNDGSMGEQGLITDHSILKKIKNFDRIYTCGPEAMMKAVAKMAVVADIPCELSLENTMACGIGACLCCVTETVLGNQCVCTDGPIFDVHKLKNFIKT